jgi:hypothetical protein
MYRTIDTGTWGDPWFEELTPSGKLLFVYLFTNNRTSMSGAYPITLRTMANETCLAQSEVAELLATFGERVVWWPDQACVFIRNFYRHQRSNSSDKYRVGAAKQTLDLPDVVRECVYIAYPELQTNPIPSRYPTDTLSTEQNRLDTEQSREETPPTPSPGEAAVKPPRAVRSRGARIPPDFAMTPRLYAYAAEKEVTAAEADSVMEGFKLYWESASGQSASKSDWNKAWMNRVLDLLEAGKIGPTRRNGSMRPNGFQSQAEINQLKRNPDGTPKWVG